MYRERPRHVGNEDNSHRHGRGLAAIFSGEVRILLLLIIGLLALIG